MGNQIPMNQNMQQKIYQTKKQSTEKWLNRNRLNSIQSNTINKQSNNNQPTNFSHPSKQTEKSRNNIDYDGSPFDRMNKKQPSIIKQILEVTDRPKEIDGVPST